MYIIIVDIVKRENSIEQINQEGFVFKVFHPSSEQKEDETTVKPKIDAPKINEEVIGNLCTEESTFLICNPDRLLNARVLVIKLLFHFVYIITFIWNFLFSTNYLQRKSGA